MKKLIFILMALVIITAAASAQTQDLPLELNEQILLQLGLDDALVARIMIRQREAVQEMKKLDLDTEIYIAQLKRLMIEENVDKEAVKNMLEEIEQLRTRTQWLAIEARLNLKEALGNENYSKYLRVRNRIMQNNPPGTGTQSVNRINEPDSGAAPGTDRNSSGTQPRPVGK